jgi:hypothetical protein
MCIAIPSVAMRMIEAITIYLATGAPFGVSHYFQREQRGASAHALLGATVAALLWPLAATLFLARRRRRIDEATVEDSASLGTPDDEKTEQARRELLATLRKVEELAEGFSERERRRSERAAFLIRESLEKYMGLTFGARAVSADAQPAAREMELCRISGRGGDDLLLAGRCIHRRNVARLMAHRERARTHLLHALAEVREMGDDAFAHKNLAVARHTSVALVRFYAHAINLLSLLEDEGAASVIARLLDAECARLRRLEAATQDRAPAERATGEERCIPHVPPLAFIGPPQTRTLPQG